MGIRLISECKNCGRRVEWDEEERALRHIDPMPSGYKPISCMHILSVPSTSAEVDDDAVWEVTR